MTLPYALLWLDHENAKVFHLDEENAESSRLHSHMHYTRQHGSNVRSVHEFFADVCDALAEVRFILVTGSKTAQADFRHYVEKHRPAVAKQIVDYVSVDRETDAQLVAMARKRLLKPA